MSDESAREVGRICLYARQQCTTPTGCPTVGTVRMGDDLLAVELRALGCDLRGAMLYLGEVYGAPLRTGDDIVERRRQLRDQCVKQIYREIEERRRPAPAPLALTAFEDATVKGGT